MLYLESSADLCLGKKVVDVELKEGATFGDLLGELEHNFGSELSNEIYDSRKQAMHEMVKAILNGVLVHNLDGSDTALDQGDSIIFVPFAVGG